ncbi:MAG: hypothetical protein IPP89_12775 [Saprospiraceae bacterium]|nr:hypothetical protein [Candidatus Brachybacter algidus]MBL0119823.1 hypothetical protein [Candidatus Brachybacter algidus]
MPAGWASQNLSNPIDPIQRAGIHSSSPWAANTAPNHVGANFNLQQVIPSALGCLHQM